MILTFGGNGENPKFPGRQIATFLIWFGLYCVGMINANSFHRNECLVSTKRVMK